MTKDDEQIPDTVSATLSRWLAALEPAQIPDDVKAACIDTVIDTTALCIAARNTDYVRALIAGWDGEGGCTALGHGAGFGATGAAMINGTAAHGEDFDNTFEGCPVHSGAVVVPAVFAAAERYEVSGARALAGIAAGIEVMCRLGLVAQKGIHSAGFHPTAVLGAMGATAGIGVALGLTGRQLVDAFGVAGSMASGIIEYLADGSWTKRMHAGWAASSGLRAALMGKTGFSGPGTVFEGTHGLFHSFAPSLDADFSPLTGALGERWRAANLAFKPYACGTMAQPYVDCAIELKEEGVEAADIAHIVCEVGEGTVHRLWEPLAAKHAPPTPYGAKFSTPYCMAVGFVDGDAGLAQFTDAKIADPAVLAFAAKITYEIDPDNEYPANFTGHLRAKLVDGTVHEIRRGQMRGGARAPLSRVELVAKAKKNIAFGGWDEARAERLIAFCQSFGDDTRPLTLAEFAG
ncbi:MAG: MmgE/PrpD family protein [Proteobacteria bacterium]|nr:MmgE/PrpD family protein [Pseudomonadota bacterium]